MKLNDYDIRALAAIRAYYRVWVEWSQDPADQEPAIMVRHGGAKFWAALRRLKARNLIKDGPSIFGGGIAWTVLPAGHELLAKETRK